MDIKKSTFCAHRGASGNFPENTMCAFNAALALGATWIETDLNLSSDEKLVIFHDANLGRTTSDSGALSLLTQTKFKALMLVAGRMKRFLMKRSCLFKSF